jgi:hypothetical protein
MAIKTFKEIIDNNGYRINSKDREIFEQGNLQSFFGISDNDAIEFVVYDANDNQLPLRSGLVRYITLTTENIRDYILIPEGTVFQRYQFPKEYFVDVERILKDEGYRSGIFRTQVTLVNKRVGGDGADNKLWISEISPSRTEVRLFPIKKDGVVLDDLQKRYDLFYRDGVFRDDTITFAVNFIDKIKPQAISTFIRGKYSERFFNKLKAEYKIQDFEIFANQIYTKFVESCLYEFTNRHSQVFDINYGQPRKTKPPLQLSKNDVVEICKRLLMNAISFLTTIPNSNSKTTFDTGNNDSFDEVGYVLQRLTSDTRVDTSSPQLERKEIIKPKSTNVDLQIAANIKKETPSSPAASTPNNDAPYSAPKVYAYSYDISNYGSEARRFTWRKIGLNGIDEITLNPKEQRTICAIEGTVSVSGNYTSILKKDVCNEQEGSVTNTIATIPSVTDPIVATGSDPIRGSFGGYVPNTTPPPNDPPSSYSGGDNMRRDLGGVTNGEGLGWDGYFGS